MRTKTEEEKVLSEALSSCMLSHYKVRPTMADATCTLSNCRAALCFSTAYTLYSTSIPAASSVKALWFLNVGKAVTNNAAAAVLPCQEHDTQSTGKLKTMSEVFEVDGSALLFFLGVVKAGWGARYAHSDTTAALRLRDLLQRFNMKARLRPPTASIK